MGKRVVGTPFKKGQSGNPFGRPKGSAGLSGYISAKTKKFQELADMMLELARDPDQEPADRINAVKWLADRGLGRVAEAKELQGLAGGAPTAPVDSPWKKAQ